ncbi:MAG TPA: VWA domain-containing protein [Vicinamibacterales bacterium]|nr:VWA domain-containing protein [Vicinamibacterales bacterium]
MWLCLAAAVAAAPQFTSQVNLVEVYATVTDSRGAAVTDLAREEFDVLEDGERQQVTAFVAGDFPLAAAVALDRSFSMDRERLTAAKSAARLFLGELRPEDQAMVIAVGSEIQTVAPLSTGRAAQYRAVETLDRWGTTSLHDAIIAAIDHVQPARGRRALLLLSDGDDRYSRATAADALARARRADVLIYPIAVGERRVPLFAELAALTGGRSAHVRDVRTLPATMREIARELRHQYLLGYTPRRPLTETGEWRAIAVRVKRPGLTVRARDGYLVR